MFLPDPSTQATTHTRTKPCQTLVQEGLRPSLPPFCTTCMQPSEKTAITASIGPPLDTPASTQHWFWLKATSCSAGTVGTRQQRNTSLHIAKRHPGQRALQRAIRDEALTASSSLLPMSAERSVLPHRRRLQPLSIRAAAFASIIYLRRTDIKVLESSNLLENSSPCTSC